MRNNLHLSIFTLIISIVVAFFNSCTSYKKLPYLKDLDKEKQEELLSTLGVYETAIKPNDILSITVNSTVQGAAMDFNLPLVPSNYDKTIQTNITAVSVSSGGLQNYLVDKNGTINFPVLGELKVSGMTVKQIQDHITGLIYPRYISVEPVVNVRLLNFKVSVLGEVNKPGIYESDNGQMTILDALAAAGDMTIYGKRDNVILLRITETGDVRTYKINLQNKDIAVDKNTFYLQQNDKLYVETNKAKGNNSSFGSTQTLGISALSILISIVAILTR